MSINYIFGLLGGLALFLYGMELMSRGLELVAGARLRTIIEKMTSNLFKSILVGTIVTAIIQSSSATTVMVVGFVNAGVMNIYQAVGIIMGANIGTTITGQLVALNITLMAPLIAFIGFVMFT
ncbi:MAG: Na/Pi symporter, partial [Anaerococcus sp.]